MWRGGVEYMFRCPYCTLPFSTPQLCVEHANKCPRNPDIEFPKEN
jgi:hypothetical protein